MGLVSVFSVLLMGCDQSSITPEVSEELENNVVVDLERLRATKYLDVSQRNEAALWLAIMEKPGDKAYQPSKAEVSKYEAQVNFLTSRLLEDRRMVANRTVQVRDMLAEHKMQESLLTLLSGFGEVAKVRVAGNYSAYCQWYLILRQNKMNHLAAIAEMKLIKKKL